MTIDDYTTLHNCLDAPPKTLVPTQGISRQGNTYLVRNVPDLDDQGTPVIRPLVEVHNTPIQNEDARSWARNLAFTQDAWREYFSNPPEEYQGMHLPSLPLLLGIMYRTWQERQTLPHGEHPKDKTVTDLATLFRHSTSGPLMTNTTFHWTSEHAGIQHGNTILYTQRPPLTDSDGDYVTEIFAPTQLRHNALVTDPRLKDRETASFYEQAFGPLLPGVFQYVQEIRRPGRGKNSTLSELSGNYPCKNNSGQFPCLLIGYEQMKTIVDTAVQPSQACKAIGVRLR